MTVLRSLPAWFALLYVISLTACVSATEKTARSYSATEANRAQIADRSRADRLVTYEASVDLTGREPDSIVSRIIVRAEALGGYLLVRADDRVSVRVPSADLAGFLDEIATYGTEKSRVIRGQDVTDEYYDQRIRLENAEKSRQRYLTLLDRAETVAETVLIEKELGRLTEEIERFKGRLRRMDETLTYSLVTVEVSPPVKYGPLGYVGYGLWKVVAWLF